MSRDLTLAMKLQADASRMTAGLLNGERGIKRFASTAKREFESVKSSISSIEGKIASLGVTIGVTASIIQSAKLDKSLTQIGQTAGASEADVKGLRKELFMMSQETGQSVDDLKEGFNNAVQSGLRFSEALPVIDATNKAMAVTGASADKLTSSLTVASTAFGFDLSKPNQALQLLDQMTVAGRLGNAELTNLSDIFARVGPSAASAGMGFSQTLSFIEGLSQIERQPERLATLADSTLRLFNNLKYMKDAQKATKVKFFNADGSRRDAMAVVTDIKKQFDKLTTDKERAIFIQKAFGQADLDTIKGMRLLLSGEMKNTILEFTGQVDKAGGAIVRDLPKAISNSVDQVGRLKASLRDAADGFAQPINDALSQSLKFAMDKKSNGGLGMDGTDMLIAGGGGALATILAAKYGSKAISGIAGKINGIGSGVATGKALETAAGITPVYVVNMGEGGMGGIIPDAPGMPKSLKTAAGVGAGAGAFALSNLKMTAALLGGADLTALSTMGAGAMATASAVGAGSLAGGYAAGHTQIGGEIALQIMKFFGSKDAAMALDSIKAEAKLDGVLTVNLNSTGAPTATLKTNQPGLKVNMSNGPTMVGH